MKTLKKIILPILLAGIWINLSEFFRNEVLVKKLWISHYNEMGLEFPAQPVNGIVWMLWGFLIAIAIFILSKKFTLWQTTLLSWFMAFGILWVVMWNLLVLPKGLLLYAIPLSFVEVLVATLICKLLYNKETD